MRSKSQRRKIKKRKAAKRRNVKRLIDMVIKPTLNQNMRVYSSFLLQDAYPTSAFFGMMDQRWVGESEHPTDQHSSISTMRISMRNNSNISSLQIFRRLEELNQDMILEASRQIREEINEQIEISNIKLIEDEKHKELEKKKYEEAKNALVDLDINL